ncbi:mRNA capping enzyme, alpha subunit [Ophiobolus disseminans]|uniref:mRNA-capping enzyme subunit alpha n=1 Tax=Ophiobolus disseminans TaxID=1469910 RepID=A0A6A6ZGC7_9PLEO|nr:mRNA capping enzyme, alpha subunit [Ophiobolus disseminans]
MPSTVTSHAPPPPMPGFLIPNHEAGGLKDMVAGILHRDNPRFPGAQPISFAREHVAELQNQEYFMCEKTDGLRCLLFLFWQDIGAGIEPATFLIDRKNNYYQVQPPLRIPYYKNPTNPEQFLFSTLLDGELVHDHYPNEAAPRLNFYIFDCLAVDGENVTGKMLDKRLGRFQEWVLKPYHKKLTSTPNPDLRPFALKEKKTYPAYSIRQMFDNVLPTLKHGNDGLIFTCKSTPYKFGTDDHILKWKPPHENTIDFKLRLGDFPLFDPMDAEEGLIPDYDAMPTSFQLLVQHSNDKYQPFTDLAVTPAEWDILKGLDQRLDGRIIECYRTPAGQWKFKAEADGSPRWRDDKKHANHISTVNSVLASIEDPVTEEMLLDKEEAIKRAVYFIQGRGDKYQPPHDGERDAKKRKFSDTGSNGH